MFGFDSLRIQDELVAKCLICDDGKDTVKNAVTFSRTSKVFQDIINSSSFFKNFVYLIDPIHPWFSLTKDSQADTAQDVLEIENTTFKHKYFDLRNTFLLKNEIFPGVMFDDALVSEDGIEVLSFHPGIVVSFPLKENPSFQSIKIPEEMRIPPREAYQKPPCVARSKKFLAISHDYAIYIYTPDGKNCLAKYEVTGEICQLTIIKEARLCVVEKQVDGSRNLVTFDLEIPQQQDPVTISLPQIERQWPPPEPICFGEKHLIYIQNLFTEGMLTCRQIYALPLSCLSTVTPDGKPLPWIEGASIEEAFTEKSRYMLPDGDHFIEVDFKKCHICDISKITITEKGFVKTAIAQNIVISKDEKALRRDVCFHNDYILFAYDNLSSGTKIFSYDILSNKVAELSSTSRLVWNSPFKHRFFKIATTIYYLIMSIGKIISGTNIHSMESNLIVLTFGKV